MMIFDRKYKATKNKKRWILKSSQVIHRMDTMWISSVDNDIIIEKIEGNLIINSENRF